MEGVGHTGCVPGAHRGKSSAQRPAGFRGHVRLPPGAALLACASLLRVSAPRLCSPSLLASLLAAGHGRLPPRQADRWTPRSLLVGLEWPLPSGLEGWLS